MKKVLSFLTGLALLSQADHVTAQTGAVRNKGLEQFFSTVLRSSPHAAADDHPVTPVKEEERDMLLRSSCEKIIKEDWRTIYLNDRNGKMKLQLRGIYTQGQVLYFSLRMRNRSSLDYDVATIRFFVADARSGRQPLVIRGEVFPLYIYDSSSVVRGYGRMTNVVALPRFTLPHGKRLLIEVLENNGGRHLQLLANNFMLERAHLL